MYEVFLSQKVVGTEAWRRFFARLMQTHRQGERAELYLCFDGATVHFYLETARELPYFLTGAEEFALKRLDARPEELSENIPRDFKTYLLAADDTILTLSERLRARDEELTVVRVKMRKMVRSFSFLAEAVVQGQNGTRRRWLQGASLKLLDLDLRKNYLLARRPKYVNLAKSLRLLTTDKAGAVMDLNTYPYLNGEHYLSLKNFDFYKHTAVFGATGSGKTKFLSFFIEQLAQKYGDNYHLLVIDPHAAMIDEVGGLPGAKVYDFATRERSLSLFLAGGEDTVNSVEMTLGLIKTLMAEAWNARLERLLRACLYLLIEKGELSFGNLRRLLTDATYKNGCLAAVGEYLPESLQEFFGQDYNELRTQHYDATFAAILSLVDELQLTPAFYRMGEGRLDFELTANRLTLISLNQAKLGEKAVKVLAGLIMNQLFALGVQRRLAKHTILVVDEVAVVENPILMRFLAEARKYGISVVLAGQYFSQISPELRTAMYANVANYFCFRLNYDDAEQMADYLEIDLADNRPFDFGGARETFAGAEGRGERLRLLTGLANRQMVARVSHHGVLLPAVMGESLDFVAKPEAGFANTEPKEARLKVPVTGVDVAKPMMAKSSILDLMRSQSTSRKKI